MVHCVISFIVAPLLPFRIRYRFVNLWCIFIVHWVRICCGVKCIVEGQENIPLNAAVFMCNHQSALETFLLQWYVSPQATVLKKELLRIPFFGWGLWLLKPIAIDRSQPRVALKQLDQIGSKRIKEGCSVVIYPVVPRDVVMLRLIPTAVHTLEDVNYTVNAFKEIKRKIDNDLYPHKIADFTK